MTNINEDKSKIEMHVSELKGISEEQMKKLDKVPGKPNHKFIKLDKQVFGAAMKFLELEETRKKLDFARGNIASKNV